MSTAAQHDRANRFAARADRIWPIPPSALMGTLVIAGLTFLVYLPALHGGFFLDDQNYMADSPLISSSSGWHGFWHTRNQPEYYPVSYSAFWLEWRLWGSRPTGYHVINLLLHVAAALLIWKILNRLAIPGAFFAALLFAVHPVNVESVAWIFQCRGLLALVFCLSAILCYLNADQRFLPAAGDSLSDKQQHQFRWGAWFWYGLSLAAFVLSMLSKGSVAVLPLILLLIVWWQRRRIGASDLARTIPFFLVAAALTAVNIWFLNRAAGEVLHSSSPAERLAGAGEAVWFYLSKALLPLDLSVIYPYWSIGTSDPRWWLPLLAAAALAGVLWWRRNSATSPWNRSLLFGLGFFCVALLPVMGFAETNAIRLTLVADRYQHLAIIGVLALVAAGWSRWREGTRPAARWTVNALAVAAIGALALLAGQRSSLFGEPVKLYEATLASNSDPNTGLVLRNNFLGNMLLASGRPQEAVVRFQEAVRLKPDSAEAHNNLANALMAAGRAEDAIVHYQEALRIRPDYIKTYCNLGNALLAAGQVQQAVDLFQKALKLDPDFAEAHYFWANALARSGHPDEAIQQYQLAVQSNPDYAEAHNTLGSLLFQSGHLAEALEHYQQALRSKPDYADAHNNLAIALAGSGQMPQAIEHFHQALELEPNNADTHHNLGVALVGAGRLPEAIDQFKETLRLQPSRLPTYARLTAAYDQLRRPADAIATAEKGLEVARSSGQTEMAAKIEDWLTTYRASQPAPSDRAASP